MNVFASFCHAFNTDEYIKTEIENCLHVQKPLHFGACRLIATEMLSMQLGMFDL